MRPFWILRGLGGLTILFANLLFAVNIFNTIVLNPVKEKVVPGSEVKVMG